MLKSKKYTKRLALAAVISAVNASSAMAQMEWMPDEGLKLHVVTLQKYAEELQCPDMEYFAGRMDGVNPTCSWFAVDSQGNQAGTAYQWNTYGGCVSAVASAWRDAKELDPESCNDDAYDDLIFLSGAVCSVAWEDGDPCFL